MLGYPVCMQHSSIGGRCGWQVRFSTVAKSYLTVKICVNGSRSREVGYRVEPKVVVESPYILVTERRAIPFPAEAYTLSTFVLPVEAPLVCLNALISFCPRLVRRRTLLQSGVSYITRYERQEEKLLEVASRTWHTPNPR